MKPFILVNCAMSADGKLAGSERRQVRISSEEDMVRVKNLRRKYDAILVGIGTVMADDPHLTVKNATYDENPVRIVVDSHGRIPDSARVLDDRAPTVIITDEECTKTWPGTTVIRCGSGKVDLTKAMDVLASQYGIENVIVEGGGELIASFFKAKLVDKYSVFVGGLIIGGRTAPTPADGDGWTVPDGLTLHLDSTDVLGNGVLLTFTPQY